MAEVDVGRALAGLGAAFKNEMPAFIQQTCQEDALALQQEDRNRAISLQNEDLVERRKKTLFQDMAAAKILFDAGDYRGIADLMEDRVNLLRNTDADTSHSRNYGSLAVRAAAGDPRAISELGGGIQNAVAVGYATNQIPMPALPSIVSASDIDEFGNITTRNSSGGGFTTTSTLGDGESPRVGREERNQERNRLSGEVSKLRSLSRDALDGYQKLDGLAAAVRYSQRDGATENDVRAGRVALGTIQTLMARMASPGVVTEQDFRTQAGAQDISSAVMNKLASLGESDINIASIMASFDASNPLSVDVDQIIQQAKSLTSGTTTGLLNDYAGLKRTAINYQMSQPFMNSYFGRDSALNLNRLAKIQNDKFDSDAYFDNPIAYLDLQEEQARSNTPPDLSIRAGSSRVYANEAEAQAAGARGEFVSGDIITINGVSHTAQ